MVNFSVGVNLVQTCNSLKRHFSLYIRGLLQLIIKIGIRIDYVFSIFLKTCKRTNTHCQFYLINTNICSIIRNICSDSEVTQETLVNSSRIGSHV